MTHIAFKTELPFSVEQVFNYRTTKGALQRLTPYWQNISILKYTNKPPQNGECTFSIKEKWLPKIRWRSQFSGYIKNECYTETLISGPFKKWIHTRHFKAIDANNCEIRDEIYFLLPLGLVGKWLGEDEIKKNLTEIFDFRYKRILSDCKMHQQYGDKKRDFYIHGDDHPLYLPLKSLLLTGGHNFVEADKSDTCILLKQTDKYIEANTCTNLINDKNMQKIPAKNWELRDKALEYIYSII